MSVFEKIDMFSASLPKMCVYCAYGYPVVFGRDDWLEVFACGAHLVENLRSKRTTLDKHAYSGMFDGPAKNAVRNVALEIADTVTACANLAAAYGIDDLRPYLAEVEIKNRERGRYL